jgi:hypothetical protein
VIFPSFNSTARATRHGARRFLLGEVTPEAISEQFLNLDIARERLLAHPAASRAGACAIAIRAIRLC